MTSVGDTGEALLTCTFTTKSAATVLTTGRNGITAVCTYLELFSVPGVTTSLPRLVTFQT